MLTEINKVNHRICVLLFLLSAGNEVVLRRKNYFEKEMFLTQNVLLLKLFWLPF